MFTEQQKQMLIDALTMYKQSNKRMQASKPQFKPVFDKIDLDITELEALVKGIKPKAA